MNILLPLPYLKLACSF